MYIIAFTPEQLAVIDAALQNIPFKDASPIFISVQKQINDQNAAREAQQKEAADKAAADAAAAAATTDVPATA
jgi:hypothetical protein